MLKKCFNGYTDPGSSFRTALTRSPSGSRTLHPIIHSCAFLVLRRSERWILAPENGICWVLSCSPAPIRSVSSVNLVEKGEVVLPPPDYLGAAQPDRRMEAAKGAAGKPASDRAEQAGPVSARGRESTHPTLLGWAPHEPLASPTSPTCAALQPLGPAGTRSIRGFAISVRPSSQEGRIVQG